MVLVKYNTIELRKIKGASNAWTLQSSGKTASRGVQTDLNVFCGSFIDGQGCHALLQTKTKKMYKLTQRECFAEATLSWSLVIFRQHAMKGGMVTKKKTQLFFFFFPKVQCININADTFFWSPLNGYHKI